MEPEKERLSPKVDAGWNKFKRSKFFQIQTPSVRAIRHGLNHSSLGF
jgi:hypothetical protein